MRKTIKIFNFQFSLFDLLKIRSRIFNSRGFTLVELLIYMALLAIFLLTLTDILVSILDVRSESEATSNVEQDGRFIVSRLSYDIGRASVVISPPMGTIGDTLRITLDGAGNAYSVINGKLQVVNYMTLETNNLNGSETSISSISFQRIGNVGGKDTIKIQFTIQSVTQRPSGPESRTFQTTAGLR